MGQHLRRKLLIMSTKISQLPVATSPVAPDVVLPVVQDGLTKKASIDQLGFLQSGTGATTRTIQNKLRDVVSVKDFGVVGNGVTDDVVALNAAMVAAATANLPLDLNGLDVAFSGDVTVPTSPALRGMANGTLRALTSGGKIIFGAISLAQYENLIVQALIEDRGLRDSNFTCVYAKLGWLASATSRDILYNHYNTCEFGFGLTSGVSFNIAVPSSPNNPFSANQFTACKFRSNVGLIALDTTSSTGRVRGNVFSSCDMSGTDVIIKAGSTFSGNCFIGGYYELGGDLDFSASDNGNSFFGGRMDNSRVLGIENFTHFEGSSIGRSTFAHTSLNGVNFAPSRPRVTAGGNLLGWVATSINTGIANDAAAPGGFSGSDALKLTTLGLAGGKGIFFQVPSSEHKGSIVSIAARVYVPSTYAAGFNPTLALGDSTGIVLEQNILQRNEWVTVSMSLTPVLADYINCFVYLSRLNHSLTNEIYVDWISVTNGGIVSLYQSAVDDHHTQGDTLKHYGDFQLDESAWNQSRLRLGAYYLWVDATGDLRIKSGAPTSDTDGTIVGTQS